MRRHLLISSMLFALAFSPACASVKSGAKKADKNATKAGMAIKEKTHGPEQTASKKAKKEVKELGEDLKKAANTLEKKFDEAKEGLENLSP